ncbi:Large ribosomal subunit protein bL9-like protein [Drosera capensis]
MAYTQCGRSILHRIVQNGGASEYDRLVNPLLYAGHGIRYRKLEIILTTNVNKLGKAGETVKVAPGYFRNYLMPKLLAVPNIEKFAILIREQRKIYEPKETEEVTMVKDSGGDQMSEYISAAKCLDNGKLVLRRYIKVDNEIREPVTKDEIVSEVARQLGVSIQPENLHLPTPLLSIGEFEVPLRLPRAIPLPEGKMMRTLNIKIRRK